MKKNCRSYFAPRHERENEGTYFLLQVIRKTTDWIEGSRKGGAFRGKGQKLGRIPPVRKGRREDCFHSTKSKISLALLLKEEKRENSESNLTTKKKKGVTLCVDISPLQG